MQQGQNIAPVARNANTLESDMNKSWYKAIPNCRHTPLHLTALTLCVIILN